MAKKYSLNEVILKIKEFYPGVELVESTFVDIYTPCTFKIKNEVFEEIPQRFFGGKLQLKKTSVWENPGKKTLNQVLQKIIEVTETKHPDLKGQISLSAKNYEDTKTRTKFKFKDSEFESTGSALMKYGIPLKILGKSKSASNKRSAKSVADEIKIGNKKSNGRDFLSFNPKEYKDVKTPILFTDKEYGSWLVAPKDVLNGVNHPKRSKSKVALEQRMTLEEVSQIILLGHESKSGEVIPGRAYLQINPSTYVDTQTEAEFVDAEHGKFWAKPDLVFFGQEHPRRSKNTSKFDREIEEWLLSLNLKVEMNVKFKEGKKRKEIGIFLPEKHMGIEFNGLYWHNKVHREKTAHWDKREFMDRKNMFLFQIYEDEWVQKKSIVKSLILNRLGLNSRKIMARKTTIKVVSKKDAYGFLTQNHLMGPSQASFVGLYEGAELVSLLTYKKFKDNSLEIIRFCNKQNCSVIGGLSRLIRYCETTLSVSSIKSWVDLRYGNGISLKTLGFQLMKETLSFKWTDNVNTFNRLYCRAKMDSRNLSEKEYALEMGLFKIYDAGQALYVKAVR